MPVAVKTAKYFGSISIIEAIFRECLKENSSLELLSTILLIFFESMLHSEVILKRIRETVDNCRVDLQALMG